MNRTRRILSTLGLAALLGTTLPACVVTARGRIATGAVVAYDQPGGNGGVIIGNGGVVGGNGQGGVIVNNGQGGLVATNGAGTVISQGGQVVIVGPTMAPPPPRVENPGAARRGYVWIEGAYGWNDQAKQYEWVPGHWERAKAGHRWAPVRWELRGNVYVRVGGEWQIGN